MAVIFLGLGALFLAGLAADQLGRGTKLPRVTLLLGLGLVAGQSGADLIPAGVSELYDYLAISALTMVAFLLGSALDLDNLRAHGRAILLISVSIVLVTVVLVTGGLVLVGLALGPALILGAIATATAPAATQDAIRQADKPGAFSDTLRGIVAIDDAWGMLAFSLCVAAAHGLNGQGGDTAHLVQAAREILGGLALGVVIGLPAAALTGRLSPGEPLQTEALGLVFVTAGAALAFEVSYLIAAMTAGAVIVNRARHHDRAFHEIEHLQWPFMMLFFLLAGASLEVSALAALGAVGAVYFVLRIAGRIAGGWLGAQLSRAPVEERAWYGVALLPQAGVAVGMALVAAEAFPEHGDLILTLTIGTTVAFELIGPAATIWAVTRVAKAPARGG